MRQKYGFYDFYPCQERDTMAVRLLCLCLLLLLLCPSLAKKQLCPTSASSCDECIRSNRECAWCTLPHSNVRCHTSKGLRRAGCPKNHMYNPQGELQVVRNDSRLVLHPQEISLYLRPGVNQPFPLTITMPTDQPITELTMDTSPVPAGVNITFGSIVNGNPLVVQVNVEAAQCPSESDDSLQMQNRTGPWSVHITPRGFSQSVKLEITLECQCECTKNREENSRRCSGTGALVCGQCECYESYIGQQCQREADSFFSENENRCRSGPGAHVCSGRGKCVEGFCECETRVNPNERYTGQFCECSNFDCPYHNNRICGGHGTCQCGECICDAEWTGEDCSCTMETASCRASNQNMCNNRGMCDCGICKCEPPYAGPTCELCPTCENTCSRDMACVECQAFGTGEKKDRCDRECGYLTVTMVETREDILQPGATAFCKMRSSDDSCFFYYSSSSTGQTTVARAKDCPRY